MAAVDPLNIVALVSGGKDSFYSILHCLANGHRVIALANLYPSPRAELGDNLRTEKGNTTGTTTIGISPGPDAAPQQQRDLISETRDGNGDEEDEADLNSFMYQTVGHQVIPLYAQATGLPLFRQPILGTAVDYGISYQDPDGHHSEEDETESLVPLLRAVLNAYPEVNALCTGAILSTYQRTRVESVALRLGLIPLAYLWQFPELPLHSPISSSPTEASIQSVRADSHDDDAQLLRDMAAVGLEARIVKVASAGLGEEFLWENVASETTVSRIRRALRRFGGDGGRGAVLGEGGEFETLVVDGPPTLFKGRVVIRGDDKKVIREGGGNAWLSIRDAIVEMKGDADVASQETDDLGVRIPELLDLRFSTVIESLYNEEELGFDYTSLSQTSLSPLSSSLSRLRPADSSPCGENWYFVGHLGGIEKQTTRIVDEIRELLDKHSLPATVITSSVIVLRRMIDFPTINKLYGALFREPNPPARVTISCDMLPRDANIAILLTVQPRMKRQDRRGLHVQSRSYWAPANIGPYSQAIAYPLLSEDEGQSNNGQQQNATRDIPLAVSIAGQIPLVPASMTLPPISSDGRYGNLPLQITLALQHLWRVGIEMKVQWWSSAVAYFPHSPSPSEARHRALLAATAWKTVHTTSSSGPLADVDDGPDLWDRKYNPLYMTYGDSGDTATRASLPVWEVLKDYDADAEDDDITQRPLPFVFSAEVEGLPRSAGVEWHAHMGFANASPGSVRLYSVNGTSGLREDPALHHVVVEAPTGDVFVQTVAVYQKTERLISFSFEDAMIGFVRATTQSLGEILTITKLSESAQAELQDTVAAVTLKPKLTYVDPESFDLFENTLSLLKYGVIIPCRSLWDSRGRRLDMVSVFETRWARMR